MVSQNSPAALQRQMQDVRRDLSAQAGEIVKKARTKFDWRHYVAKYPWIATGAAASVGFLLVPRRARCKGAESAARTEAVGAAPRSRSALSGVAVGIATGLATTFIRDGLGLGSELARQWLEQGGKPSGEISPGNGKSA
jgi:hypothetical protein